MGRLLLNEQDVKKIVGEETGLIAQRVNEVETNSKDEIRLAVNKIHLDIQTYETERLKDNKETNDLIAILMERINKLEESKIDTSSRYTGNVKIKEPQQDDDILNIDSLYEKIKFPKLTSTKLKYFLYENGIYDMKINETRDSYSLKETFSKDANSELIKYIHTDGEKVTFSKDIVDYLINKKLDILDSSNRYDAKKEQYKISRNKVAAKQVKNYEDEVKRICKVSNNETSRKRYNNVYNVFAKTFPTFFQDLKKYREEHHVDGKYDITIVKYVVEIMQQGNLLLKIACELYVN